MTDPVDLDQAGHERGSGAGAEVEHQRPRRVLDQVDNLAYNGEIFSLIKTFHLRHEIELEWKSNNASKKP